MRILALVGIGHQKCYVCWARAQCCAHARCTWIAGSLFNSKSVSTHNVCYSRCSDSPGVSVLVSACTRLCILLKVPSWPTKVEGDLVAVVHYSHYQLQLYNSI